MAQLRVGVIFGGRSGEHEVSLMSAASVVQHLRSDKYVTVPIGITKEGKWLPEDSSWELLNSGKPRTEGGLIPVQTIESLDVIFPVLHGTFGEDGTVQGLFEMCNVPYVGAGVMASSVSMDKAIMKSVFRDHHLPIVRHETMTITQWEQDPEAARQKIVDTFGFPLFVKPANLGSSVGISKVNNEIELLSAINLASVYDCRLIIEEFVPAREIECAVLGNDSPKASVLGEIVSHNEFYDYEAKYTDGKADLIIPAQLDAELVEEIQSISVAAFKAVGCSGLARVDFFLNQITGEIVLNEINTMPGFTHLSMFPLLWHASGIKYKNLLSQLIDLAFERHQMRMRLTTVR